MTPSTRELMAMTPEARHQVAIRERMAAWPAKDVVRAWYRADPPFELTEFEDLIRQRWDFAKAQFLARQTYAQTIEAVQKEFKVSIATARRDVADSLSMFGDLDKVPREAHRQRAVEMSMDAYAVAKAAGNAADMAKATKVYVEAAGLDKEDSNQIDIEKMMAERTYVEVLDTDTRNLILNLTRMCGGVLDVMKIFEILNTASGDDGFTDYEVVEKEEEK